MLSLLQNAGFGLRNYNPEHRTPNEYTILRIERRDVNLDLVHFTVFTTSLGNMALISKNEKLISLDISKDSVDAIINRLLTLYPEGVESMKPFKEIYAQLDRYLKGGRVDFNVDIDISEMGTFTRNVLLELRKIPYGELRSYLWIGKRLGYRNAARAVGQAVKRNPIPLIIPCHRVIREDGSIGGFSLGIPIKEKLLTLEGIVLKRW
jgi:methylated-DNA-[protein]-cysteine S-methyltransferase